MKPIDLARRTSYSRQHLARVREGLAASARLEQSLVDAVNAASGEQLTRKDVFEAGDESFRGSNEADRKVTEQWLTASDITFDEMIATIGERPPTEAVVRDLLDSAESLLDRAPARADALYAAALSAAERLSSTPKPLIHALVAFALKGRSNALRMRGRYPEALLAAERAEREFVAARYCKREVAYARYCRGAILFKMERWSEAQRAVLSARAQLEKQHERAGVINCDIVLGCILLDRGEVDRARHIFLAQRKIVESRHDVRRLADIWMNLVVCDLRRNAAVAAHWLHRATKAYRELGLESEVIRARWIGASIALVEGRRARALRDLRAAATAFERLGMPVDAGFVKLDLLAELVAGGSWRAAEPLACSLVALFGETGNAPRAAIALAYLKQAVQARSATRSSVDHVKRYLRRTAVFPDEAFDARLSAEPA